MTPWGPTHGVGLATQLLARLFDLWQRAYGVSSQPRAMTT
jgi:hypothetical protein